MSGGTLKIQIEPTGRYESIRNVQFRVYKGRTESGIELEMLGLFRIHDERQKLDFIAEQEAAAPTDSVTPLVGQPGGLVRI